VRPIQAKNDAATQAMKPSTARPSAATAMKTPTWLASGFFVPSKIKATTYAPAPTTSRTVAAFRTTRRSVGEADIAPTAAAATGLPDKSS